MKLKELRRRATSGKLSAEPPTPTHRTVTLPFPRYFPLRTHLFEACESVGWPKNKFQLIPLVETGRDTALPTQLWEVILDGLPDNEAVVHVLTELTDTEVSVPVFQETPDVLRAALINGSWPETGVACVHGGNAQDCSFCEQDAFLIKEDE